VSPRGCAGGAEDLRLWERHATVARKAWQHVQKHMSMHTADGGGGLGCKEKTARIPQSFAWPACCSVSIEIYVNFPRQLTWSIWLVIRAQALVMVQEMKEF
jgi:hypothetical protein